MQFSKEDDQLTDSEKAKIAQGYVMALSIMFIIGLLIISGLSYLTTLFF